MPVPLKVWTLDEIRARTERDEGTCWLWTRSTRRDGYAQIMSRRRCLAAHRVAFALAYGEIPDGLHLHHLCGVRRCVNPAHLTPITQAVHNRLEADARATCRNGHPRDALTTYYRPAGTRECRECAREARGRRAA